MCGSGVTRHSVPTVMRAPRSHMLVTHLDKSGTEEDLGPRPGICHPVGPVCPEGCLFQGMLSTQSLLLAPLRSLPPSHPFLSYVTGVNLGPLSCPSSFKPSCPCITRAVLWPCLQERHRACLHSPEGGKKTLLEEGLSSSRKAFPSPPDHHPYLQAVAGVEL